MPNEQRARIVCDTNILVSAFLFPNSVPGQALELVLQHHRLLMSLYAGAELADVIRRDKFDAFLSPQRREELIAGTIRDSEFVETSIIVTACRDL